MYAGEWNVRKRKTGGQWRGIEWYPFPIDIG